MVTNVAILYLTYANESNNEGIQRNSKSKLLVAVPVGLLWFGWVILLFVCAASNSRTNSGDKSKRRASPRRRAAALRSRLHTQAAELRLLLMLPIFGLIDGVGIWAIHNHGLVHITAILELFVVVGEAYIFYLWMCILVFYAVEKRHADVGQILLSDPYSRVKIGFPKFL